MGRSHAFFCRQDLLALLVLCGMATWLGWASADLPAYKWNWSLLCEFIAHKSESGQWEAGLLLRGLVTTLRIGLWTIALSLLLGGAAGRYMYRRRLILRFPCHVLINLVRSTPPLVILFCIYFFAGNLLPMAEIESAIRQLPAQCQTFIALTVAPPGQMDRMFAAVLALGCYQAAYVAEIARGALEAVPQGQWDAGRALGFDRRQTLKLIVEPQALRLLLPPLVGQCISTIKDSALASLISLPELTFQSLEIMAVSNMTFEIWTTAALLYLLVGLVCAMLGKLLERQLAWKNL